MTYFLLVFIDHLYVDTSNNLCEYAVKVEVKQYSEQKVLLGLGREWESWETWGMRVCAQHRVYTCVNGTACNTLSHTMNIYNEN